MILLRSTLFNLLFFCLTPLFSLLLLAVRPFGYSAAWSIAKAWSRTTLALAEHICGIRVVVEGREHLPHTPCVVVAKHQSALETIAMPLLIPPYVWVLKKILLYIPIFGWALWAVDAIAINRGNPRQALKQMLHQGVERLQSRWIVVFPEGTRSTPGEARPYHAGGVILAKKAQVALLPLALNSGLCWPKRGFIKRPGTVTLRFLPPIDADTVAATDRTALLDSIRDSIERECAILNR
ncbi:MAG: lysophospholipid acyltransferase family protein [Mariprofundales bacterium]|nr:lysophospholipid acyltransferase family protein [Mariprofundales bacterium]